MRLPQRRAAAARRLPCTRDLAADLRFGPRVVELSPGPDQFDPERILACRRRQTCPKPRRESRQKVRSAGAKNRRARGRPTRLPATKNRRGGPAPGASSKRGRKDCGVLESSFCGSLSAPSARGGASARTRPSLHPAVSGTASAHRLLQRDPRSSGLRQGRERPGRGRHRARAGKIPGACPRRGAARPDRRGSGAPDGAGRSDRLRRRGGRFRAKPENAAPRPRVRGAPGARHLGERPISRRRSRA